MKKYILFFYIICCTTAYNITTLALFKHTNNTYTIHGLWPTFSIEPLEYPSYCSHDKFQVSLLEPIGIPMKKAMSNFGNTNGINMALVVDINLLTILIKH